MLSCHATAAERIVGWAISDYLMNCQDPNIRNSKLVLSKERYTIFGCRSFLFLDFIFWRYYTMVFPELFFSVLYKCVLFFHFSIVHGLSILQSVQNESRSLKKTLKVCLQIKMLSKSWEKRSFEMPLWTVIEISLYLLQDIVTDNEFEKRLLAEVIPPSDIGVTFDDIGALENVKETLKELVMLPLQRPELFCKGQLTKVCSIE